ncbi:MAG: ABC transporter ATP-binding protein, partial [Clostridiales bacterium]|nr:ABC transporter ATP-binding protein [Clostridiales bacterium]
WQASDFLEKDEVVIEVSHVSIDFKRDKDESSSIKELVIRTLTRRRTVSKFRALDDVSFTVNKGEVLVIIGTNGSDKSTILKIISGVLSPTEGSVKADRRKIQLLTLGTGFDPELTGRENVYLNGALIGYSKKYIDEKYDEIVKFAELEGFMEERVRNYSSGMVSRLGFAISTIHDSPEILILDEVLSVGDMFFRKKSMSRIQEMIHGGSTVLIVSHSTSVIRQNCTKVVWIEKGKLRMVGEPGEACAAYEKMEQA